MRLATTTEDFARFCKTNTERVSLIAKAGFKFIDLSLASETANAEIYLSDNWHDNVIALKNHAESLGVTFVQCHAPGMNPFDPGIDYNHTCDLVNRSIEVCGMLGIKNTVLHNVYRADPNYDKDEFYERNLLFYSHFYPMAEKYEVNILCENTTKKNMPNWYFPTTGKELLEFIRATEHPLVHACWDTGHANCDGSQYEHIVDLGEQLYALHINDNTGHGDEHILPYFGTLNLDDVINGLSDIGYKGYFTFECCSALRPSRYWQGHRHEFSKDTRLSEPALFMQERVERLMYEIGEYALRSYDYFEE